MTRRTVLAAAAAALLALPAGAQTVDEIVANNIKARGGMDKLKAAKTIRMSGRMTVGPGLEAPFVIEQKRPNKMRLDIVFQGITGSQAYDGATAWMVMPFMGKKDPEVIPAEDAQAVEEQADFDGILVDSKAKGHTVELLGKEPVEGADAWKLKVTLKDGAIRYIYLEADSFLEIRTEGKRKIRGSEVEGESSIGDYKEVAGMMMAHSVETGAKGAPQRQKITIDKIEVNPPIEDSRFVMPEVKKEAPAPAKQ